ncbi:Putative inner membrane protein YjeT (clustered with HflC) [Olavius algarvensis associated proteobacterium Delta 3]|nr:Putative inner membrane protein YjeT (clustered with HflC) [Olavius algarvensis associated proteobacterium Delta 3]CAB5157570.1 Putative inner membrane protein YjeT (clustered with HflC) [Olavius algarvensis associated proteobacterium Delta 3]
MKYFLSVIGMVMIIEGLPYFAFPEKMKVWVQKVMEIPDSSLRKFGFALMGIGLLLVYFGRNGVH